jgi:hypothetical protein
MTGSLPGRLTCECVVEPYTSRPSFTLTASPNTLPSTRMLLE